MEIDDLARREARLLNLAFERMYFDRDNSKSALRRSITRLYPRLGTFPRISRAITIR